MHVGKKERALKSKFIGRVKWWVLAILLVAICWVTNAWAAEGSGFTRATWDEIWRWINFFILFGVIIKFGRRPIVNFLDKKKEDVAESINKLEERKRDVQETLQESQRQLTTSEERLVSIKSRIVSDGENRKAQLIADAQEESRIMLETAKLRIDQQIREMHSRVKAELIDAATQIAFTKLPGLVTSDDQDRLVGQWMDAIQS
jgi:F-type H+-transporting ATPase subunit b